MCKQERSATVACGSWLVMSLTETLGFNLKSAKEGCFSTDSISRIGWATVQQEELTGRPHPRTSQSQQKLTKLSLEQLSRPLARSASGHFEDHSEHASGPLKLRAALVEMASWTVQDSSEGAGSEGEEAGGRKGREEPTWIPTGRGVAIGQWERVAKLRYLGLPSTAIILHLTNPFSFPRPSRSNGFSWGVRTRSTLWMAIVWSALQRRTRQARRTRPFTTMLIPLDWFSHSKWSVFFVLECCACRDWGGHDLEIGSSHLMTLMRSWYLIKIILTWTGVRVWVQVPFWFDRVCGIWLGLTSKLSGITFQHLGTGRWSRWLFWFDSRVRKSEEKTSQNHYIRSDSTSYPVKWFEVKECQFLISLLLN